MKNIKKLFILFLFAFFFVGTVNAGVSDEECNINITEDSIDSAGFDIRMPICSRTEQVGFTEVTEPGSSGVLGRKATYQEVIALDDVSLETVYYRETADGKDWYEVHGSIPVCSYSNKKVVAYSTCTATKVKSTDTVYCREFNGDQTGCEKYSNCSWENIGGGKCLAKSGTSGVAYTDTYCAGSGWEPSGTRCKKTYEFKQDTTGTVSASVIEEACKSATGASACSCKAPTLGSNYAVEYGLDCPLMRCVKEYKEISACTPSFSLNDQDVYCVNPGQHFSGEFKYDSTFNVRNCINSYSTTDCGYANILIEGAFHREDGGISNDAINLALRLWSYHMANKGFEDTNRTGVANRQGDSCTTSVYFMKEDGSRPNVYKNTYDYIMTTHKNDYFTLGQRIMEENGYLPKYITEPETNKAKFNGSTFGEIACNGTVGVTCGGKDTYRVAFELFFNTMFGNKYMQQHLNNLYGEEVVVETTGASLLEDEEGVWVVVEYNREDFEKVFGEEEVIPCDPNNPKYLPEIEPYCRTKITYYNADGEEIEKDVALDECRKTYGCVKKTTSEAICTPVQTGYRITEVKVKETKPKSSYSVRKYMPCGTLDGNQIMFSYFTENVPGDIITDTTEEKHYFLNYLCGNGCDNYNPRVDPNTCSDALDVNYKTSIKDPSLSCVVNMADPTQAKYYEFTEKFGLNKKFCRVYCSDQVDYYLAGKTEASSGRFFRYDVRDATSSNTRDYLLSGVVKEKRSCVSEIFFDNLSKNEPWQKDYDLTEAENAQLMANSTWTTLFNILYAKSGKERDRKENLNQMVYDLYNCNLYALNKDNMNSLNIYKPGNDKNDYALKIIKNMFAADKDYGLDPNKEFSDVITYKGGANVVRYNNGDEGETLGKVGKDGYSVKTGVIRNESNGFGFVKNNSGKIIRYCSGVNCLTYNKENEDYLYSHFNYTFNTDTTHGYKIPTNNYALFEIETETSFYNKDKYQVFGDTGNVLINTNYPELLTLEDYAFPVSRYAYTECPNGVCEVTQTINIKPYIRAKESDPLQEILPNQTFKCSVITTPPFTPPPGGGDEPGKMVELYRNVDLTNLFPYGVSEDSNWNSEEGIKAKTQIEGTANLVQGSDELLDYRITLNPEQIKAVKAYNKDHGGSSKEKMNCPNNEEGSHYYNCTSSFLDALRGKTVEYQSGTELGTLDPEYTGVNRYTRINGN